MELLGFVAPEGETGSTASPLDIFRNLTDEALAESTCVQDLALHAFEALERRMCGSDEYNKEDYRRLELLKSMAAYGLKIMAIETARRFEDKYISELLM